MSDVVSDDELNALAAEYVLGTLDYEERQGASALLEVDNAFRGIVRIWERRFGDLHLMVEAVEPDPQLWQRIKPKIPGIEQMALAIPSHADEAAIVAAAAATASTATATAESPVVQTPVLQTPVVETPVVAAAAAALVAEAAPATPAAEATAAAADVKAPEIVAESTVTEASVTEAPVTDATVTDASAAEGTASVVAAEATTVGEASSPAESTPTAPKPDEAKPDAIGEAELKLAELAALLPVPGGHVGAVQAEPLPEDGLHTHAPDLVPRGFVPPAPMSTRGMIPVVQVPVRKIGRGWVAATLMMGLVSVVLAGLISAWRYFPERLPAPLRAYSVLNLPAPPPPAPAQKPRPKLAPFDE